MKRASFSSARLNDCLGQDVLAAVLLQVIEPSRSINYSGDGVARLERACRLDYVVDDVGFIFKHIDDLGLAEPAGIVRLTSPGWIERGLVQYNAIAKR